MNKKIILIFAIVFISTLELYAQIKPIDGKIFQDPDGSPIGSATITSSRNNTSVYSDSSGRFRIDVDHKADTLIVSHFGFETKRIPIDSKITYPLEIFLEISTTAISEIVLNTGYQTLPKERATGSFFQIDNQALNKRVGGNILDRLEGLSGSLLIDRRNEEPTIQIRGISTLNGDIMKPLIVLDNFPYEGDLSNINPNDIESITVLKDAAASSIWGARAGNGVIVINSKRTGTNQKPLINFNSNLTLSPKPNLYTADQIGVGAFVDLEAELFDLGFYDILFSDPTYSPMPQTAEILEKLRQGLISRSESDRLINELKKKDLRSDMSRYLYRPAVKQQYHAGINGTGKGIRYLFSTGFDSDLNSLKGNSNQRITLRTNNSIDITDRIEFQIGSIYTTNKSTLNSPGGYGSYMYSTTISPYASLVDEYGKPASLDLFYRGEFTDLALENGLLDWKYRPLQELYNNDKSSKNNDLLINLGLNYKVLDWLNVGVKYQNQKSWIATRWNNGLENYATRDIINRYSQLDGDRVISPIPRKSILHTTDVENTTQALRGQIEIAKDWANLHEINAIAGGEIRQNNRKTTGDVIYGYDENLLSIASINFAQQYPTYEYLYGNTFIPNGKNLNETTNRFISLFTNIAYTYNKKYTLSASARRDASNLFGVKTNQKWVPLWSIGGLWRVDQESWVDIPTFTSLNLRVSYGLSGNLSPNASSLARIAYYDAARSPIGLQSAGIVSPPNPNLRWEQVKTFNLGVDFGMLNGRLTGSIDVYKKNSYDLLNSKKFDPITGTMTAIQNSASLASKGLDLVLTSVNTNGEIKWSSSFLLNFVSYKVTENLDPIPLEGLVSSGNTIFPVIGYSPYLLASYKWAGLNPENGNPRGYVNGQISEDYNEIVKNPIEEQVVHGAALPPLFGNLRNSFEWNNFSLSFNISYRLNYYFRKPSLTFTGLLQNGSGYGYGEFENRWKYPGDERTTNVPSFLYPADYQRDNFYVNSEINVEKADNIKLEEVFLQYNLRENAVGIKGIKGIQLYTYLNNLNLFLWKANKVNLDPDRLANFRTPINMSLGLKITFQ
ncbi:SusC/RagA family TonB-linked outer membrane protein [Sphingobacterium mizutaii NBRC 14946 = DSM 11724]|uniref:Outer membrane cobalamin receptor protein n=2 Tax=Sphingobacterium mizutaii TaxID=1010 RepID=A0AAJ4X9M0_9SPHI|nr:SusC/RagA family TonB-linked outer membrane protein [Sphingobacterium mizutaii]GEM68064.1 SusC/RagA family TonB-linked outer membrane protein [Sphingobacterium mizutaii NBRC 14946 = DSM 11724]SDL77240.1 TonB-linked outer membrane protein, SusC/RagA family [Sphingobacterium mizutaii]SNV38266.1 Outer membrane cobalamin receptor protein [Sphingobacterium mizutaii]